MPQGDCTISNNLKEQLLLKTLDFVNDVLKVALFSVAADITDGNPAYSATNEIVAAGYTAGGATLGNKSVAQQDTPNNAKFDADDITWNALGAATILQARLYDDTVNDWVLLAWEIATNSNGGNYTLAFNVTNGILLVT